VLATCWSTVVGHSDWSHSKRQLRKRLPITDGSSCCQAPCSVAVGFQYCQEPPTEYVLCATHAKPLRSVVTRSAPLYGALTMHCSTQQLCFQISARHWGSHLVLWQRHDHCNTCYLGCFTGDAVLLTGQQGGSTSKVMRDGPRGTASFVQPRGLCVERTTGQVIMVDGPSPWDPLTSHSAVLRTVAVSGPAAGVPSREQGLFA
jgi:hypothetical protein